VLAAVAGQVYALERIPELARELSRDSGVLVFTTQRSNASTAHTAGTNSRLPRNPGRRRRPRGAEALIDQLAAGGRLVLPIGTETEQRLIRITRAPEGVTTEDFGPCQFVKLIGRYGWEK